MRIYSRDELKQSEMQARFGDRPAPLLHRRRPRPGPPHPGRAGRRHRRPRRRDEAGARLRVQPVRGGADQRARRPARRRRRDRRGRRRRSSRSPPTRPSTPSTSTAPPSSARRRSSSRATPTPRSATTRLSCVRYGNVVGSRGSVVPAVPEAAGRDGPAHDHRRADDPLLDHARRRPSTWSCTRSSTWSAARSSSRRSRRCGSPTWPRRWRPASPTRSSASARREAPRGAPHRPTRAATPIDAGDVYVVLPEHPWWTDASALDRRASRSTTASPTRATPTTSGSTRTSPADPDRSDPVRPPVRRRRRHRRRRRGAPGRLADAGAHGRASSSARSPSHVGAAHAVAFANGTAALHGAARAAGLGPGDLVATSPLTFVASANCARYVGRHARASSTSTRRR